MSGTTCFRIWLRILDGDVDPLRPLIRFLIDNNIRTHYSFDAATPWERSGFAGVTLFIDPDWQDRILSFVRANSVTRTYNYGLSSCFMDLRRFRQIHTGQQAVQPVQL